MTESTCDQLKALVFRSHLHQMPLMCSTHHGLGVALFSETSLSPVPTLLFCTPSFCSAPCSHFFPWLLSAMTLFFTLPLLFGIINSSGWTHVWWYVLCQLGLPENNYFLESSPLYCSQLEGFAQGLSCRSTAMTITLWRLPRGGIQWWTEVQCPMGFCLSWFSSALCPAHLPDSPSCWSRTQMNTHSGRYTKERYLCILPQTLLSWSLL